jgi:predicted alpha/beta hydrolase
VGPRARLNAARGRIGGGRRVKPPKTHGEELELRATDGVSIACTLHSPERRPIGDVVLAHGAFSRQSSFTWSGGLADFFRGQGYRVLTFDFRGHGKSGTPARDGGAWGYDDLVRKDLPAVVECLRARRARGPLWVVGHSLGGHVALAAQGTGRLHADGIVTIGTTLWRRANEPSPLVRGVKRLVLRAFAEAAERNGFFPARRLRLGSDDEALGYVRDIRRMVRTGWRSADGQDDYDAGLATIAIPVFAIASEGDRWSASPHAVRAFHAAIPGAQVEVVARSDGDAPPDHAELVTTMKARAAFERALDFLRAPR